MIVMGFYYGVWADEFASGATNIVLVIIFILGTLAYTLFTVSVLIVSITDAKRSSLSEYVVVELCVLKKELCDLWHSVVHPFVVISPCR